MIRDLTLIACTLLLAVGCDDTGTLPENLSAPKNARLLEPAWQIDEFEVVTHDGALFSRGNFLGRWTLVFSGFTHCPDICPTTLGIMKAAQNGLDRRDDIQTVFVTVDPERDTPKRLAEYLAWFDDDWIGVTGERQELNRLLDSLQMAYVRVPTGNGEYTMDHATAVALINPKGRMAAFWRPPLDAAELREDLESLPPP